METAPPTNWSRRAGKRRAYFFGASGYFHLANQKRQKINDF